MFWCFPLFGCTISVISSSACLRVHCGYSYSCTFTFILCTFIQIIYNDDIILLLWFHASSFGLPSTTLDAFGDARPDNPYYYMIFEYIPLFIPFRYMLLSFPSFQDDNKLKSKYFDSGKMPAVKRIILWMKIYHILSLVATTIYKYTFIYGSDITHSSTRCALNIHMNIYWIHTIFLNR